MRQLYREMEQSYQAETRGISHDELTVGTALPPVVWHQQKREAIEQHHQEGEESEPFIELSDMLPKVGISLYRCIFDSGTHSHCNH